VRLGVQHRPGDPAGFLVQKIESIQPGAAQPLPEEWPEVLKRIIDAGKRCQVYVTAEGARKIVREIGGKGFALYVVNRMNPDEAADFLKVLAAEDISLK